VRDKSSPLDLPEVEQLIAKLKKLDIDYGCVVSRAGFTGTAKAEADRNGIELRTIAQVENSDWWLASAVLFELRQVELLHFQMNFRPEELADVTLLLAGAAGTELELTLASGETASLNAFVAAQGTRAIDRPELAHLADQETFTVTIDFSDLRDASLKCPRGPVSLPQSVYALYRLHHRVESVKLAAYQGPQGVNAFTGISSNWKKQITLVTQLNPDGTRSISLTTDDPTPPKTTIGQRRENAEQSHPPDAQKDARG
jgi:hypothetical protein